MRENENFNLFREYSTQANSLKNLIHHTNSLLVREDTLLDKSELLFHDSLADASRDMFIPTHEAEKNAQIRNSLETKKFYIGYSDGEVPGDTDATNIEPMPRADLHNAIRIHLRSLIKLLSEPHLYEGVEQTLSEEKNCGWFATLENTHALAYFLSQTAEDSNIEQRFGMKEEDAPFPGAAVSQPYLHGTATTAPVKTITQP